MDEEVRIAFAAEFGDLGRDAIVLQQSAGRDCGIDGIRPCLQGRDVAVDVAGQ